MIFDDLPFEMKEHFFTYVSPNEWVNTAKVSKEWLELTLGSITKVQSCNVLTLDHLAEFINQERKTNYTWSSLLALMPRLERLECCENTAAFWHEISPICDQLKVLHCEPVSTTPFDWNELSISYKNLTELHWHGCYKRVAFPFNVFRLAPKLEKLTLKAVYITAEWEKKIPKNVKHILLGFIDFNKDQCCTNFLCEDPSSIETFSFVTCTLKLSSAYEDLEKSPRLKNLELSNNYDPPTTAMILHKAFKKCPKLETVKAYGIIITDSWRRVIPESVKSLCLRQTQVKEDIRSNFSPDSLFKNYGCLQSFHLEQKSWTGFDTQKFCSSENLKKLALYNRKSSSDPPVNTLPMDPFSDICAHMVRGSHLVDVTLNQPVIHESWRHVFPPTVKRLNLEEITFSKEASIVFSPQFICENPSTMEVFSMEYYFGDELPAMDVNAFSGMNKLRELHLLCSHIFGDCLQSILTHCSSLIDLTVYQLKPNALSNLSHNLTLPSLRKLSVKEAVGQPSLVLDHFPNLRTLNIAVMPSDELCSDFLSVVPRMETVEVKIMDPSWTLVRRLIDNVDHNKFRYFCLMYARAYQRHYNFSFCLTNSIVEASRKLYTIQVFRDVLWIKNYPTSPLLRKSVLEFLPSSMKELALRFDDITAP